MKKVFLLSIIALSSLISSAQIVLDEEFDEGLCPPPGWSIDAHASNWSAENTSAAGGIAPEGFFYYYPTFVGISRLISPVIDLTGHSTVLLKFNHFIDHYAGTYNIGIATRSNGGSWTSAWEMAVTSSIPATTVMIPLNDINTGSSTFQFCLYFSGNSDNINSWSIDNINLLIPATLDGAVTKITVPTYFTGSLNVTSLVANLGLTSISSFQMNWQLDDGEIQSDMITGVGLSLGDTYEYSSSQTLTPEAGVHDLKVWISDVNAINNPDNDPANDTLVKVLRIPSQTVERVPFFEEFTSSTCGPCANFNSTIFNPFLSQYGDQLAYVKYQMSWPSPGDPYYTPEGGVRRSFYGVNAVPMLYVEGKNVSTATSTAVTTAFNEALANPAFVVFDTYYTVDGYNLYVRGQLISYTDLVDATLHIVVFENMTTQNVGSNGETEFHHVMMKMIPDAAGTSIEEIQAGVPFIFEHTVDMSTTFVEELDDLNVVVFLQDNSNKEIFQSSYADLSGVGIKKIESNALAVYPNPSNDQLNIRIPADFGKEVTIEITDLLGKTVKSFKTIGNTVCTMPNDLRKGTYNIRLIGDGQQVTTKFISIK